MAESVLSVAEMKTERVIPPTSSINMHLGATGCQYRQSVTAEAVLQAIVGDTVQINHSVPCPLHPRLQHAEVLLW